MSNIEKIRQEIERLKEEYNEQVSARLISESLVSMGKVEALNKVLAFIESLPEEKPSEDLEEEAARYERENRQSVLSSVDIVNAFIAGGELQKGQMMKKAVEVDVADLNGDIYNNCIEKGMTDEDKVKIVIVKQ